MNISNQAIAEVRHLVDTFISRSPKFYEDSSLDAIDSKHQQIVTNAYEHIGSGASLSWGNFRNWQGQSDLAVPVQVSRENIHANGFIKTFIRFIYTKMFRRFQDECLRSSLLDDIEIINRIGALQLMKDNPVSSTPGAKHFFIHKGHVTNMRWSRYIYLLKRILDLDVLKNAAIWVDVGSYYGGLQGLIKRYQPDTRMVLVDFHHQLCRSYLYLSKLFPEALHIFPDQISMYNDLKTLPTGAIMYVPAVDYKAISLNKVSLATNFFSFGEMRRVHFNNYVQSSVFREAEFCYTVNRFVSAPFFEKTYDSDLTIADYLVGERKVRSFDVFPIHYYLLIEREVLGRKFVRNTSCPYFELLTIQ